MESRPTLFLDFDGVLVLRGDQPHEGCIEQLNLILAATDADIVVSSAWRLLEKHNTTEKLTALLESWGVRSPRVVGMTGLWDGPNPIRNREIEIERYVGHNDLVDEAWCAVDDSVRGGERFVVTSPDVGLTESAALKCIEWLRTAA